MAKKKTAEQVVIHNFVAKHMHEVNKSQVFVDRKKNAKRGYNKHRQGRYSMEDRPFFNGCLRSVRWLGTTRWLFRIGFNWRERGDRPVVTSLRILIWMPGWRCRFIRN